MTDFSKLTDRELDAKCAEFIGKPVAWCAASTSCQNESHWIKYTFSTDLNAARELEAEIERRGLSATNPWWDYAAALMKICRPDGNWQVLSGERIAWIAARATARQRAEAFAATMEAAGGAKRC